MAAPAPPFGEKNVAAAALASDARVELHVAEILDPKR
jgi:hypothetical protein